MADAYARATGKVGVIIATSGPGATNLVTGIANAMMDSVPLVAITGQVRTELIGNDAFQEADMTGITRPITKHNMILKNPAELPQAFREAFYIARTGRPGPVLIDLPVDMQIAQIPVTPPTPIELPGFHLRTRGHARQISLAAQAINEAKRPVLYVGGGVIISNAAEELRTLAQKANIPVTMSLLGLGAYDQGREESLDMLGMHGSAYANYAVQNCDLLIAVGARFDDRVTGRLKSFAPHAKVIHVDLDPASISKNVNADIPVVGDAREVLRPWPRKWSSVRAKDWFKQIAVWKKKHPFRYDTYAKVIKPPYVIEEIWRQTQGQATIVPASVSTRCGRPVLQVQPSASVHHLRRPGHHGLRPACRHRRPTGPTRRTGHRHRRRQLLQHDPDGTVNRGAVRTAHQGLHPQQRLYGYGPSVAGTVLRQTLFVQLSAESRLCQPGPCLRRRRLYG
jgi:acetolactate synthase-1/2/3 large subunit